MRMSITIAAAGALVAACGQQDQPAGGITAEESRALNEHAETLDASPDSLTADEADFGNDEWIQAETGNTALNAQ
jgi:hypothetical protein